MNQTGVIAVLVTKGILSKDEGEKFLEFLNNHIQGTHLADAIEQVEVFVTKEVPALIHTVTPAIEATAKNEAKKATDKVIEAAKTEAEKVAEAIAADVKAVEGKK